MSSCCGLALAWAGLIAIAPSPIPSIPFEKYTLRSNGLEVVLSEDRSLPIVAVNVWYHAGPINEPPKRTGFAHLFEHLMFQGSRHVGDDQHFKLLEARGGTDINGTTGYDRTNYLQTVPAGDLELALWLESDRMGFLLDDLTAAKLDNQRQVVLNEKRQSVDNAPYGPSRQKLVQLLVGPGHPYYGAVIGSMEDLEAATLDDVREFYRRYYAPSNATLVIAGDFDAAGARALVKKYFATLPCRERPARLTIRTEPITSERRAEVVEPVNLPQVAWAWQSPVAFAADDAEADVLAIVLAGGESSRLYRRLVYDLQLAQDVGAAQEGQALVSFFTLVATAADGGDVARLEQEMAQAIAQLQAAPPSQAEVDRAVNGLRTEMIAGLQKVGGFSGRADMLNRYNQYLGDPGFLGRDLARYAKVTPAAVQQLARRMLKPSARVAVITRPRASAGDAHVH